MTMDFAARRGRASLPVRFLEIDQKSEYRAFVDNDRLTITPTPSLRE